MDIDPINTITNRISFFPRWVLGVALAIISLSFFVALAAFSFAFTSIGKPDWIAPALSVIQMSAISTLIILAIFFVERAHSAPQLSSITQKFLTHEIPMSLLKIDHQLGTFVEWTQHMVNYDKLASLTKLKISYNKGNYTAYYIIYAYGTNICLQVEANIKRFNVVFIYPQPPNCTPEQFFNHFSDTIKGAENAGYHVGEPRVMNKPSIQLPNGISWDKCIELALHSNSEGDYYLYNYLERAHIAQDLSVMVRSFIEEGIEAGVIKRN